MKLLFSKRKLSRIIAIFLVIIIQVGLLPSDFKADDSVPEGYTAIYNIVDLYNIRLNPDKNYILMNDIDMTETKHSGEYDCGSGWKPIPNFEGVLDGNGYSLINCAMYGTPLYNSGSGLICINEGIVKNLNMINVAIEIENSVGSLAYNNCGEIDNCSISGNVVSNGYSAGGIVCDNKGYIKRCTFRGSVRTNTSYNYCGGIAAINNYENVNKTGKIISSSTECGSVFGNPKYTGGICGVLEQIAEIKNSFNGLVSSGGGVVGYAYGQYNMNNAYAMISNSYNYGDSICGGIIGTIDKMNTAYYIKIENCYTSSNKDGLSCIVGQTNDGDIVFPKGGMWKNNYYILGEEERLSNNHERQGIPLQEWEMKLQASYEDFDFDEVWTFTEASEYPQLQNNLEGIVNSISLYSMPKKTNYYQNEEFDIDGAKISICYQNEESVSIVPVEKNMVGDVDMSEIGNHFVNITYKEKTAQIPITVLPILPDSIELDYQEVTVDEGKTVSITATVLPDNATYKTVEWSSRDSEVATVDDGEITGISRGDVEIVAKTSNGKEAVCLVHVLRPATELTLDENELVLNRGSVGKINAILTPGDSTDTITYESDNESVCTVDNQGNVTAVGKGETTLTVSTNRGLSKKCHIIVKVPSESIVLNYNSYEILKGDSFALESSLKPSDSTDIVSYTSGNNEICSVTNDGVVTGEGYGTTVITATTTSGEKAFCTVCVKKHIGGHSVVVDKGIMPTCESAGLTEGTHCSECGEILIEQQLIPKLGHQTVIDTSVEATCTHKGLTEGSHCSRCGKILVEQNEISILEHSVVIDPFVSPTCSGSGLTIGSHCSVCGKIIVEQRVIDAKGHSFGEWKITREPSCTEEGLETRKCDDCDETETRVVAKEPHSYSSQEVLPTCIERGYTLHTCDGCGKEYRSDFVDAKGHSFGEWKITREPSCVNDGEKIRKCLNCDATQTEKIDKIGHNFIETLINPTCLEKGYINHKCSLCDFGYNDTYVDAKGHNYSDWIITKPASYTEEGIKYRECSVCKKTETVKIPLLPNNQPSKKIRKKPSKVKFSLKTKKNRVTVKWRKISGVSGYTVWYKKTKKGRWKRLKTLLKKTKYTKKRLKSGKKYYFTVKAFILTDGKRVYGKSKTKRIRVR